MLVYQRANLHFPMVSYGFPMVFWKTPIFQCPFLPPVGTREVDDGKQLFTNVPGWDQRNGIDQRTFSFFYYALWIQVPS